MFEKGTVGAALVALDLIAVPRGVVEVGELIKKQTDIPGAHAMTSATHSRTGPVPNEGSPRASARLAGEVLARATNCNRRPKARCACRTQRSNWPCPR